MVSIKDDWWARYPTWYHEILVIPVGDNGQGDYILSIYINIRFGFIKGTAGVVYNEEITDITTHASG